MNALILVGVLAVLGGVAYATHAGLKRGREPHRRALPSASLTGPLEGWRSPPPPLPPAPPLPSRPTRIRVVSRTPSPLSTSPPLSTQPTVNAPPPLSTPPSSPRRGTFGRWRLDAERRGAGGGNRRFRSTGVGRRGCPYCINEIVDGEATSTCTAGHTHHRECIESNGGQCAVTHCGHPAIAR
jgi:hypothetical protein